VQLRDLARLDGSPWTADAIEIGGRSELRDRDLNLVARPRVMQYAPNDLDPLSSRILLSNRRKTLARLLSRLALLSAANQAGARSATQTITGSGNTAGLLLPAPTIGPIYGESSARGGRRRTAWCGSGSPSRRTRRRSGSSRSSRRTRRRRRRIRTRRTSSRVSSSARKGAIPNSDTWETLAFMATNPGWYKKVYVFGVGFDGAKGLPLVLEAQATDTISPTLIDITDLAVSRAGDTATVTWTNPGGMSSSQPIYILLLRNGFVLKIIPYVAGAQTVLDTGLLTQNVYMYEVFPWTAGISGATAPTDPPAPPTFTPPPFIPGPTPPVLTLPPSVTPPVITGTNVFAILGRRQHRLHLRHARRAGERHGDDPGLQPEHGDVVGPLDPAGRDVGRIVRDHDHDELQHLPRGCLRRSGGALYAVGDTITVSGL
jgi:hypothetical protein